MKKIFTILLLSLYTLVATQAMLAAPSNTSKLLQTNYNVDGHYWTVYLVATMLKVPDARMLAFYAEMPDDILHENGKLKRATMTYLNVFMQGKVHALTGKHPEKERERSRKMYLNAKTMKEKGRALHRLGDSYAHAKPCETKMYKRGIGHAFAKEHGHEPDMIRNYPDKYLKYVADLVTLLGGPTAKIDMTPFEYIAKNKLETVDNIEILKSEITICARGANCEINPNQSKTLQAYLDYRAEKVGFSVKMENVATKRKKQAITNVIFNFAPVDGATH